MAKPDRTCGVFVSNPDGNILICHVTNSDQNTWSIPKGRPDSSKEEPEVTAARELFEETGLQIPTEKLFKMGTAVYKSGRKLFAYGFKSKTIIDVGQLRCASMVNNEECAFPEVDDYKFLSPIEAMNYIHPTQQKVLTKYLAS